MSASGHDSKQSAESQSTGTSGGGTSMLQAQMPFLQQLWNQASGMASGAGGVKQAAAGANRMTMPGMRQAFNRTTALTNTNKQVNTETEALKAGLGDMFRKEMLPSIATDALASGGYGGARQGVAQGEAVGAISDAFAKGRAGIRSGASQTALQAASLLPGMQQSMGQAAVQPFFAGLDALKGAAGVVGGPIQTSWQKGANQSTMESGGKDQGFQMAGKG